MAGNCPSTRPSTDEPAYFRHSPVSGHFSRFIAALGAAIEAERDIEEGFWSDPAFDRWLSEAELAWERATELCRIAFNAPATRISDVPLQRIARHIHWTLGCETMAEFNTARQIVVGHREQFSWKGNDPEGRRISQMLLRAQQQFDELCNLDMLSMIDEPIRPEATPLPEQFAA